MPTSVFALSAAPLQRRCQFTSLRTFSSRSRAPLKICAAKSDPWSVLGVSAAASEKEIKQAHRKLVLKHHPDLHGDDVTAHARFMSIQEAYEVLIGKRRGKELDGRPADGWDFHDWYWRFSMKRRQGKAGGAPPAACPDALRSQWKQQLGGLRQRAAAKRRAPARTPQEHPSAAATPSSTVWRSATKNARVHQQQQQQQQQQQSVDAQARPLEFSTSAAAEAAPDVEATTPAAAPEPAAAPASHETNTGAHPARTAPGEQLHELLQHAVHAVHEMRHSHDHAVHAHAERVTSHIVTFGRRLRLSLRAHGLRELLNLDAGDAFTPSAEPGLLEDAGDADGGLHTQFEEAVHLRYAMAGATNHVDGGGDAEAGAPSGQRRARDAHSRKFADREGVAVRLTGQMAGLKRRAALKREAAE